MLPRKKKSSHLSDSGTGNQAIRLVLLLLTLLTNNVEELEGVLALVGGDDTEPVTELLLLEELLGQVLDVATGELLVGNDLDATIAEVGDVDLLAEVAGEAVDLDALLQEGGEGRGVEDAVVDGLGGVDDELWEESHVSFLLRRRKHANVNCGQRCPYLLGHLSTLLGATLVSSAAGSGVLLHWSLSILLSSLLRMCMREIFFFFCALRASEPLSRRRRSGAAKRDTYRSLHHFVGIELIWGRRYVSRSRGRKEMGILRRAELEGLLSRRRLRSRLPKCLYGGARKCKSWRLSGRLKRSVPDPIER